MNKQGVVRVMLVVTLLSLVSISGWASEKGRPGGGKQGPPPEAIAACEGKEVGDSVEFTGRRGETLKATCQERNGQMAAVPEGKRQGGERPE